MKHFDDTGSTVTFRLLLILLVSAVTVPSLLGQTDADFDSKKDRLGLSLTQKGPIVGGEVSF